MEHLNSKLDEILSQKQKELEELANMKTKNKKMINANVDKLNYGTQTTLYKIEAEQQKKLKSSKAYKKQEQLFSAS